MALRNRDTQIKESQQRAKTLESQLGRTHDSISDELASLAAERDDLQALLTATLHRLEEVDRAVQKADESSQAMEQKVRQLEEERSRAVSLAQALNSELNHLKANEDMFQWQSTLLSKMSEIQSRHQQRKKITMQRLILSEEEDDPYDHKKQSTTEVSDEELSIKD
eukprot:TRINITY_DN10629_c0_g1_i1.p3 TRINITY_DN10629_c0_g1~~TRINITY_DN10629_c0_g1_i1.p3  ORF type:complete len:166 (-),score=18.61 TRINITY_DN10629_c0_g1_i1:359-856(-)